VFGQRKCRFENKEIQHSLMILSMTALRATTVSLQILTIEHSE
jgi:hypothetical protein